MLLNDLKSDFDRLRGGRSTVSIGRSIGVTHQAVQSALQKKFPVSGPIIRLFEELGYDLTLTFTPVSERPADLPKNDSADDSEKEPPKETRRRGSSYIDGDEWKYVIRRGEIRLKGAVRPTNASGLAAARAVMEQVEREGHDLTLLPVVGEYPTFTLTRDAYHREKITLDSRVTGDGSAIVDVLTVERWVRTNDTWKTEQVRRCASAVRVTTHFSKARGRRIIPDRPAL